MPARIEFDQISKTFGSATVLEDVCLSVAPGEVHAIVGQNGSGKSTLVKILAGLHRPDAGSRILIDDKPIHLPPSPKDLAAASISFVHQDLGVLDGVSVLENMTVGRFTSRRFSRRIDWQVHETKAAEVLERIGLNIAPRRLVDGLSAAERTLVAIGRALVAQRHGEGVIVLDEATRPLSPDALSAIYKVVREIASTGGSVIVITHNLREVMAVADKVTVLRDGRTTAAGVRIAETSEGEIARAMLGYEFADQRRHTCSSTHKARVKLADVTGAVARSVNLTIGAGEILGVTGRPGSGFDELPYLVAGVQPPTNGTLEIDDARRSLTSASVRKMLDFGVVLIPEGRLRHGLAAELSVGDNLTLPRLTGKGRRWFVNGEWQRTEITQAVSSLDIRPPSPTHLVRMLSGGNQQKVLLAKWLAHQPRLLILHEPTQGVDIGARADIIDALRAEASRGTAILLASAEATDLYALCERVLILEDGRITQEISPGSADEVLDAVYGEPAESPDKL